MVPDVLTRALLPHLTRFTRELARARRGEVRGVHQARVASRRLREGLGALESLLPRDTRRRAMKALRGVSRALGAVRECDVTLTLVAAEASRTGWPQTVVSVLNRALTADRTRRHRALLAVVADGGLRKSLAQVRRRVPGARSVETRRLLFEAARNRRRRRGAMFGRDLRALSTLYVPDQLHAVRLGAKKLRYALEWESQVGRRTWGRERLALAAAQEELGAWHDLLVLLERVHRVRRSGDHPRYVVTELKQIASQLERECRARHAQVLARVPGLLRVAKRTWG